jgi:NADPH:quinone reductase-like Zn-dependent oxidoreductase
VADLSARIAQLPPERQATLVQQLLRERGVSAPAASDISKGDSCATLGTPGNFDAITFRPFTPPSPGPRQVQLRSRSVGLNFRDLMIAMGLYPPTPGVPSIIGSDYAGEVVACGEGVTRVAPGDAVLALSAGHFERDGQIAEGCHLPSRLNVMEQQVIRMPSGLSFEEGAGVPTVFLTCHYALRKVAGLQPDERVLIHSATGGIGLAAIQIARSVGAEIFATAGSETKREFLASIGIASPMDSRSTDFADQIMRRTDGDGIDVVLNTLPGVAGDRSLELLRPFGRFLQLDKSAISSGASLALEPFKRGLSYTAIDLSLLLVSPDRLEALFVEVVDEIAAGRLEPVRTTVFPVARVCEALRLLARHQHIGKVVLRYA